MSRAPLPEDLGAVVRAFSHRWLTSPELYRFLLNFEAAGVPVLEEVVLRPPSGSFFVYGPKTRARDDGYDYTRKRHDGRAETRETYVKLVVNGVARLASFTAELEDRPSFRRRIYRLLTDADATQKGVQLVHYFDTEAKNVPASLVASAPGAASRAPDQSLCALCRQPLPQTHAGCNALSYNPSISERGTQRPVHTLLPGMEATSSENDEGALLRQFIDRPADGASITGAGQPPVSSSRAAAAVPFDEWDLSAHLAVAEEAPEAPVDPRALALRRIGSGRSKSHSAALEPRPESADDWASAVGSSDERGSTDVDQSSCDGDHNADAGEGGVVEGRTNRLLNKLLAQVRFR